MADLAEDLLEELGLGGPPAPKIPAFVRNLTESDLISSHKAAEYGTKIATPMTKKLRAPHHTLARLLAEGKSHAECSAITGYAIASIPMYKKDPAFAELMEYYKEQGAQQYLDVHSRLAAVGTMALEILQDRLEETPEKITTGQLLEIASETFDRSVAPSRANGPGPAAGSTSGPAVINIRFHAGQGEAGQRLPIASPGSPPMIDVTPGRSIDE